MVETFTLVAFRYNKKNSVLYVNSTTPDGLIRYLQKALIELDADVISIRRVMERQPE